MLLHFFSKRTTTDYVFKPARSFTKACSYLLISACLALQGNAASQPTWDPVSPEDLALSRPLIEPDAAAEALFWRVDIDEKNFPESRVMTEYIRYKVFEPEKAESLMRVSERIRTLNGIPREKHQIRARIVQPGGAIKEFGNESLLERPIAKESLQSLHDGLGSRLATKEVFLAVAGAEPGAIVEFWRSTKDELPPQLEAHTLQLRAVPIRSLSWTFRSGGSESYSHQLTALNTQRAQLKRDAKKQIYSLTATNLPALVNEPHSGAWSDHALTMLTDYIPFEIAGSDNVRIDEKAGPWAVFSTVCHLREQDRSRPTSRIRAAAAELTKGATNEVEKAQRIHNRVRELYQDFLKRPTIEWNRTGRFSPKLDDVLVLGKDPHPDLTAVDFVFLALSLYRSAGLEAELLLLPDRRYVRLDRTTRALAMMQDECVALRIADKWHFSHVISRTPLAFGMLPWFNQGQGGLLARTNRQDFIDVPLTPASESTVQSFGVFEVGTAGQLTGQFRRILTGQPAFQLRAKLRNEDDEQQQTLLKEELDEVLNGGQFTLTKLANLENPDQPLEITYSLEWPGYAVLTKDRLILRPTVFHANAPATFPSAQRRNRVMMPYRWQEVDRVALRIPPGYEPESIAAPASYPGDVLSYRVSYSFEAPKRLIQARRDFQSAAIVIPVEAYSDLKKWHDAVVDSDRHELVFIKTGAASSNPSATP